ncbi:MAG: hypothetical protein GX086_07585, partial [Alcaligenaceae bacterium]|nr:hypothetical protein [Alcaligenaceae bacterium]
LQGVLNAGGAGTVEEGRASGKPNSTTLEPYSPESGEEATSDSYSYAVTIKAGVADPDNGEWLSDVVLTGIPEGFEVALVSGDTGVELVANSDGTWTLQWKSDVDPSDKQNVDLTLTISHPDGNAMRDVEVDAQVQAFVANGDETVSSEFANDSAMVQGLGGEGDTTPEDDTSAEVPAGADGNGNGNGSDSGPPALTGNDLLTNGDFTAFANATAHWNGNNDKGYSGWTMTGDSFGGDKHRMTNSASFESGPYVGVWQDGGKSMALSQDVSGLTGGSVLQLQVAWNNPDHKWDDTGNAMTFQVRFGDTVYMTVTTPSKGADVLNVATVTTYGGAESDISSVETWMGAPESNGGNSRVPKSAADFETINLRLPPDVPADGQLVLEWIPSAEGGTLTDDFMVRQVKLLEAEVVDFDEGAGGEDAPVYEPDLTDTDLLQNGDFQSYANANEHGYQGNVYGGFAGWNATGSLMDNGWLMAGKPYVGVWQDNAQASTLSQTISGVTGGSVVQLDVAWNNSNHQQAESGKSMTLEIAYAGEVYARVVTPPILSGAHDNPPALVSADGGASVNIAEIATWVPEGTSASGGWVTPDGLAGFQTLEIRLPENVPEGGEFVLRWVPETAGSGGIDDLMVANVKVIQAEPMADDSDGESMMAMQTFAMRFDDDDLGDDSPSAEAGTLDLLVTEDDDWPDASEGNGSADGQSVSVAINGDASSGSLDSGEVGLADILDGFSEHEDLNQVLENALKTDDDAGSDADSDSQASAASGVVADAGSSDSEASSGALHAKGDSDADIMAAQRELAQQMIDAGKQGNDVM